MESSEEPMDRARRKTMMALVASAGGVMLASCGFGNSHRNDAKEGPSAKTKKWLELVEQKVEELLRSDAVPSGLAAGGALLFSETPEKYSELIAMMQKHHARSPSAKWGAIAYEDHSMVGIGAHGHLAEASLTRSIARVFMTEAGLESVEANDVLVVWVVGDGEKMNILAMHPQIIGR
jgi:hypothetical protein